MAQSTLLLKAECANVGTLELGKRTRRPPMKMLDAEESSTLSVKLNQSISNKRVRTNANGPEQPTETGTAIYQSQLGQFVEP